LGQFFGTSVAYSTPFFFLFLFTVYTVAVLHDCLLNTYIYLVSNIPIFLRIGQGAWVSLIPGQAIMPLVWALHFFFLKWLVMLCDSSSASTSS